MVPKPRRLHSTKNLSSKEVIGTKIFVMMKGKISTAFFEGDSGERYRFEVYQMDTIFKQGISGVYVIARRSKLNESFDLEPLFIGEMNDLYFLQGYHRAQNCYLKQGANCKCILIEEKKETRALVVEDLLHKYNPICNNHH